MVTTLSIYILQPKKESSRNLTMKPAHIAKKKKTECEPKREERVRSFLVFS
jgi:hypothetical protein